MTNCKWAIALVTCAVLTGCARSARTPDPDTGVPKGDDYVREFTLSDGTRCAVYSGYKAGGISCGWK